MENPRVAKIVESLENTMKEEGINFCDGLLESLLLLVSSLTPITNIDLLIVDRKKGGSNVERCPFLRTGMAYPWRLCSHERIVGQPDSDYSEE